MASVKQFVERRDNIASIVSYVRSVGLATRLEISSALSLSWACVSDLVALLIERNVLTESTQKTERSESEARGRTPTYVKLNGKKYFLGVDINRTDLRIRRVAVVRLNTTEIRICLPALLGSPKNKCRNIRK